jgi:hypothetical protein
MIFQLLENFQLPPALAPEHLLQVLRHVSSWPAAAGAAAAAAAGAAAAGAAADVDAADMDAAHAAASLEEEVEGGTYDAYDLHPWDELVQHLFLHRRETNARVCMTHPPWPQVRLHCHPAPPGDEHLHHPASLASLTHHLRPHRLLADGQAMIQIINHSQS